MEAIFVKNKQRATYETLLEMMVDYIIKKSDVQDKWRSISQVRLGKDGLVDMVRLLKCVYMIR